MAAAGDIRIGVSGWTYPPWRGVFFPAGLKQRHELAYAAAMFRTIEINGTFYRLQRPAAFGKWFDETPDDFMFTVKAPRFITHIRRLREPATPLANFLASGVLRLGAKLGPILWQFPPNFRFEPELLRAFLEMLPRDTDAALRLARRHDERLKDNAWLSSRYARTDAARDRNPPREFSRSRVHRPAAGKPRRAGLRGYREMAEIDGCDGGLCLLPAARLA